MTTATQDKARLETLPVRGAKLLPRVAEVIRLGNAHGIGREDV